MALADAATLSEAIANFDQISYAKGASVLRQRPAMLASRSSSPGSGGDPTRDAYGNARLTELDRCRGRRARARTWPPVEGRCGLLVEHAAPSVPAPMPVGTFTDFAIVQEGAVMRRHWIAVGLASGPGGTVVRTRGLAVDVAGARTEVPELAGVAQPDLILLKLP